MMPKIKDNMNFDNDRRGTGTKEWAEVTVNISRGCRNNCLYCYAAHNANRFNLRKRDEWDREELTKQSNMTSYPARDGVVMFPSSHDITPHNLEAYIRVAKLILAKGNRLLIVSKPRVSCVYALLTEFDQWKEQILFRFTIGTMNDAASLFWEPGAPEPEERVTCLEMAFESGYRTSVSIEPLVGGIENAIDVVRVTRPCVTDTIWIGKMNKVRTRVSAEHAAAVANIEFLQRDEMILKLYHHFEHDPIMRWKDSIKEVVARAL